VKKRKKRKNEKAKNNLFNFDMPGRTTMKFNFLLMAALTGAAFVPQVALAQEYGPDDSTSIETVEDIEEPDDEVEDDEEPLSWDFRLTNEMHAFDNVDLLPLDTRTPQRILDTDDRQNFGYTSVSAGVAYKVLEDTTFNFGGALSGMWGNDQVGTTTEFGAPIYVYDLSVDWDAVDTDAFKLSTSIGRQGFSIGGAEEDFFFKDIVDGVTLTADMGVAGRLRFLVIDVFGDAGRPDNADFLNFIGANQQTTNNFRGDTDVYRYGGVYELMDIVDGFDVRAFGFGAYIGAARAAQLEDETSTGTDIGSGIENFADEDYNFMFGGRANYTYTVADFEVGLMAEFARSAGLDRKAIQLDRYDVNTDGNAYGAGANVLADLGTIDLDAKLRFFHADGSEHTGDEGLLFSHGFTSMKGSEIGGINMERYAGWHPSAYVSGFKGIFDNPQDIDRKAGTRSVHGGLGFLFVDAIRLDLDAWYFQDTGETNVDFNDVNIDAFGQNSAEVEAQGRLGDTLGTELNAALTYLANDALTLYAIGGIFLPGDFYETRIDRTAGTALGARDDDPDQLERFWVAAGGATLAF
jgi:hypothetical protein